MASTVEGSPSTVGVDFSTTNATLDDDIQMIYGTWTNKPVPFINIKSEPIDDGYEQANIVATPTSYVSHTPQNIERADFGNLQNVSLKEEPIEVRQPSDCFSVSPQEKIAPRTPLPEPTLYNSTILPSTSNAPDVAFDSMQIESSQSSSINETETVLEERFNRSSSNCVLPTPVNNLSIPTPVNNLSIPTPVNNLSTTHNDGNDRLSQIFQLNNRIDVREPSGQCKELRVVGDVTSFKKVERPVPQIGDKSMPPNENKIMKRKRGRPPGQKNKKPKKSLNSTMQALPKPDYPDNLNLLSRFYSEQPLTNPFLGKPISFYTPFIQSEILKKTMEDFNITFNKDIRRSDKPRRKVLKDLRKTKKGFSDIVPRMPQDTYENMAYQNREISPHNTILTHIFNDNATPSRNYSGTSTNKDEINHSSQKSTNSDFPTELTTSHSLGMEESMSCSSTNKIQTDISNPEKSSSSQQNKSLDKNSNTSKAVVLYNSQNSENSLRPPDINDYLAGSSTDDEEQPYMYKMKDDENMDMYNIHVLKECFNGNTTSATVSDRSSNLQNSNTKNITSQFQPSSELISLEHSQDCENENETENNSLCMFNNTMNLSSEKIWPDTHNWESFTYLLYKTNHDEYFAFFPKEPYIAHFPGRKSNLKDNGHTQNEGFYFNLQAIYKLYQLEIRDNCISGYDELSNSSGSDCFECNNFSISCEPIATEKAKKIVSFCKNSQNDMVDCSNTSSTEDTTPEVENSLKRHTTYFWYTRLLEQNSDTESRDDSSNLATTTPDILQENHHTPPEIHQSPCQRLLGLSDLALGDVINFVKENDKMSCLPKDKLSRLRPDSENLPSEIPSSDRRYGIETDVNIPDCGSLTVNQPMIKQEPFYDNSMVRSSVNQSRTCSDVTPWKNVGNEIMVNDNYNNDECVIIRECISKNTNTYNSETATRTQVYSNNFSEIGQTNLASNISQQFILNGNNFQHMNWSGNTSLNVQNLERFQYEANHASICDARSKNNYDYTLDNNQNQSILFDNTEIGSLREIVNDVDTEKARSMAYNSSLDFQRDANFPSYCDETHTTTETIKLENPNSPIISPPNSMVSPINCSYMPQIHSIVQTNVDRDFRISDAQNFGHQTFPISNELVDFTRTRRNVPQQIYDSTNYDNQANIGNLEKYVQTHPSSTAVYNSSSTYRSRMNIDREINPAYRFKSGGNIINQNVSENNGYSIFNEGSTALNYTLHQDRRPNRTSSPNYTTLSMADTRTAVNLPLSVYHTSPNQTAYKSQNYHFSDKVNNLVNQTQSTLPRNGSQICATETYSPLGSEIPMDLQTKSHSLDYSPNSNRMHLAYVDFHNSDQRTPTSGETELRRNTSFFYNNFLNSSQSDYRNSLERTIDSDSSIGTAYSSFQTSEYNTPEPIDFTKQIERERTINRVCINDSSRETSPSEFSYETINIQIEQAILSKNISTFDYLLSKVERYADKTPYFRIKAHLAFLQGRFKDCSNIIKENRFPRELHEEVKQLYSAADNHIKNQASSKNFKGRLSREKKYPPTIFVDPHEILNESYKSNSYPNPETRNTLAARTGLSSTQVNTWFKNRRQREKRNAGIIPEARRGGRRGQRTRSLGDKEYTLPVPTGPSMPVFPTTFPTDR